MLMSFLENTLAFRILQNLEFTNNGSQKELLRHPQEEHMKLRKPNASDFKQNYLTGMQKLKTSGL